MHSYWSILCNSTSRQGDHWPVLYKYQMSSQVYPTEQCGLVNSASKVTITPPPPVFWKNGDLEQIERQDNQQKIKFTQLNHAIIPIIMGLATDYGFSLINRNRPHVFFTANLSYWNSYSLLSPCLTYPFSLLLPYTILGLLQPLSTPST